MPDSHGSWCRSTARRSAPTTWRDLRRSRSRRPPTSPTRRRSSRTSAPDDAGEWTILLDPLLEPSTPVVIQITRGDASYRFEGKPAQASWTIDPEGTSQIPINVLDRTLELDREEKIVAWPGSRTARSRKRSSRRYGFAPQVQTTPDSPDPDVHIVHPARQRPRVPALARRPSGASRRYLEATEAGIVGHFEPIDPLADPQGELSLGFGADAQHVEATVQPRPRGSG